MNYKQMRSTLEKMANESNENFTKALISFEKGINDKEALDKLYTTYMENDSMALLNDEFDYMIDELRENGQLKECSWKCCWRCRSGRKRKQEWRNL